LKKLFLAATVLMLASPVGIGAQRGGRGGGPPAAPRDAAAIDLTGYWVAVVAEDWKLRMVTPKKGVFDALPLTPEGRRVGESWDPAKDEASGEQCRAYGAAGIMRLPGRLHVTWEDANTLRVDIDTGTQTRLFHFGPATGSGPSRGESRDGGSSASGEPSWQGSSAAQWEYASGRGDARSGNLKVVTTNLRAGYVRKNGAPYSNRAMLTEYFDVNTMPNGDRWMTVTTRVDDAIYFRSPYLTTSDFKKLPNANGWNPTPCSAR